MDVSQPEEQAAEVGGKILSQGGLPRPIRAGDDDDHARRLREPRKPAERSLPRSFGGRSGVPEAPQSQLA